MAGHAQLKFVMTECSKTQIRLAGLNYQFLLKWKDLLLFFDRTIPGKLSPAETQWNNSAAHITIPGKLSPAETQWNNSAAHITIPGKLSPAETQWNNSAAHITIPGKLSPAETQWNNSAAHIMLEVVHLWASTSLTINKLDYKWFADNHLEQPMPLPLRLFHH